MPNLGQIRRFLEPCDLEIWRMTLKNNRAPLLSNIKLYASFHNHMWIQTAVTVRKRLSWVVTSVTLTFDLWPWPFAWTLRSSLVITPENCMMIRWWEHSQKGVTDRRTDRQTDRRTDGQTENTICRAAWSQLKIFFTFDFHILPEHRRIGDKNFPCRCISIKNGDHPWGRCWPIYLESKPSQNCWIAVERAEITFISIHISANQNSYHDDKSIYILLTRALCPQLLRNLRTRRRFDSSSIIAHPVNFDKDR